MFVLDYALEEHGEIFKEDHPSATSAERRARYLSRKHHKGGYDGPLVYVYRKFGANGQRVFFAGRTDQIDEGYIADKKNLEMN